MSHHRRDEAILLADEKSKQTSQTHRKSISVLDHLKIKVKGKRSLPTILLDSTDDTFNRNNNNNANHHGRQSDEIQTEVSSHATNGRTLAPINVSTKKHSFEEIHLPNEVLVKEEDSILSNGCHNIDGKSQWPKTSVTFATDPRESEFKRRPLQATKSLPETTYQSNDKQRRQKVRRTGFQIRDHDFKLIFSDLPSDEQLIIGYPCAWRKDVFLHGRMFLTVNYLCFYTCFFKWKESITIEHKEIVSVTREKSVKLVPNAIKIRTKSQDQYLFVSHLPREKIFISIFRLWQNALLDQPLDSQQLRTLIITDQPSADDCSGDSEESISLENNGGYTSEVSLHTRSLPIPSIRLTPSSESNRQVHSFSSDKDDAKFLSACTCENHLARIYADRSFTFNVDKLFDLLWNDNSFNRAFHSSQKLTDYTYGEWQVNSETGKRERQVTYKTITQSILGTNTLSCREKQILEEEKPHLMYVLTSEVYNEGMKYTDAFYVATQFCMIQYDLEHSSLKITAEIKYLKSVNSIIRTFIEKNAHSSIEEGVNEQIRRLENEQVPRKSAHVSKNHRIDHSSRKKHPRTELIGNSTESKNSSEERSVTGKGVFYDLALLTGIVLLLLHFYLCYKLNSIDDVLVTLDTQHLTQCQKACLKKKAQH